MHACAQMQMCTYHARCACGYQREALNIGPLLCPCLDRVFAHCLFQADWAVSFHRVSCL